MDRDRIREVWHNSFEADLGLMWCFSSQAVMGVYRGLIHNKFIHSSATCIDTLFNLVLPSLPPPLRPCPLKHAAKRLLTQSSRLVEGRGQASSWRDVCVGCRPRCPEKPKERVGLRKGKEESPWMLDVGGCSSMTGTRLAYYISLRVHVNLLKMKSSTRFWVRNVRSFFWAFFWSSTKYVLS